MKVRSDAWTHEDDLLLAETVLRYIREGGTQLQAFEEVGDKLNRTSAACGFRWNAEIRRQYEQAIQIAKKQRKERKRALANSTPAVPKADTSVKPTRQKDQIEKPLPTAVREETSEEFVPSVAVSQMKKANHHSLSIDDVISFLVNMKQQGSQGSQIKLENERLKMENENLKRKNEELKRKVQQLTEQHSTIQEDYQALVQIMDRARRMVMFEDTEERQAPVFRMDKNGNLEKVAK
jgi:prespore-specific regulator